MNMKIKIKEDAMKISGQNNYCEEIFRQLTEDISHYQWALSEWFADRRDYSDSYLLLEIFERRYRANNVLSKLTQSTTMEKHYSDKLCAIFKTQEERYKKFLTDARIQGVFQDSIPTVLKSLRSKLGEITSLYEESLVYEEDNEFDKELYSAEIDFMQFFVKLFCLKENVQSLNIPSAIFCEEFGKLEANFKKKFHYFEPIKDLLAHKEIVFGSSDMEWWYTTEPDCYRRLLHAYAENRLESGKKEDMERHLIQCIDCSRELKGLKRLEVISKKVAYLYKHQEVGVGCPPSETLGRYALDKSRLPEGTRTNIDEHLATCIHCLDDVITMRADAAAPREIRYSPIPFSYKYKFKLRNFCTKIQGFISQNLVCVQQPIVAGGMGDRNIMNVPPLYEIKTFVDSGELVTILYPPEDQMCPPKLYPLCNAFRRGKFYYKVFGIHQIDDRVELREIFHGVKEKEYMPLKITRPDTNFLIVCLARNEKLLVDKTNLLLDIINDKTSNKLDGLISIFVEIENVDKTKH